MIKNHNFEKCGFIYMYTKLFPQLKECHLGLLKYLYYNNIKRSDYITIGDRKFIFIMHSYIKEALVDYKEKNDATLTAHINTLIKSGLLFRHQKRIVKGTLTYYSVNNEIVERMLYVNLDFTKHSENLKLFKDHIASRSDTQTAEQIILKMTSLFVPIKLENLKVKEVKVMPANAEDKLYQDLADRVIEFGNELFTEKGYNTTKRPKLFSKLSRDADGNLKNTKKLEKIVTYLKQIQNGKFIKSKLFNEFTNNSFKKADPDISEKLLTPFRSLNSLERFLKKSITSYIEHFKQGVSIKHKDMLPDSLDTYFYNDFQANNSSWFLIGLKTPDTNKEFVVEKKLKAVSSSFVSQYLSLYSENGQTTLSNPKKTLELKENIEKIYKWYIDWSSNFGDEIRLIGDQFGVVGNAELFAEYHCRWLSDFTSGSDRELFPGHIKTEGTCFKMFIDFCKQSEIDFDDITYLKKRIENRKGEQLSELRNKIWDEVNHDCKAMEIEHDYIATEQEKIQIFNKICDRKGLPALKKQL